MDDEFVRYHEFQQYCTSNDAAHSRIEASLAELGKHIDNQMNTETNRRRKDTRDAVVVSKEDLKEAIIDSIDTPQGPGVVVKVKSTANSCTSCPGCH